MEQQNLKYQRRNITCQQWDEQQIEALFEAYRELGCDYEAIAKKYFPQRNVNQIKCKLQYLKLKGRIPDMHIKRHSNEEQEELRSATPKADTDQKKKVKWIM